MRLSTPSPKAVRAASHHHITKSDMTDLVQTRAVIALFSDIDRSTLTGCRLTVERIDRLLKTAYGPGRYDLEIFRRRVIENYRSMGGKRL